ncbi:MAG TPA: hypothetical protein VES73_05045 [Lamprocystis sp. (in: g-proteobacteria)]|nr:hypothetical protein [Lamprocystis sp. (in: g-proteobacteria)]
MAADLSHKLYDILASGWRQRYVIAVPMLLMPILGGFVGAMTPPHFRGHTSLLIVETALQNPIMEDLAVKVSLPDRKAGLTELLKSRHVIGKVVDDLKLAPPGPDHNRRRDGLIGKLRSGLGVSFIGKDMLRITYDARSTEKMKEILQGISDQFVDQILAPERSALESSVNFLTKQLEDQKTVLDTGERALANFKDANPDGLPEFFSQNMGRLAQLKVDVGKKELQLAGARETLSSIGRQLAHNNPVVGNLEKQIVELRGDLALLSARYTAKHSKVQGVTRQLERLEAERARLMAETGQVADIERMLNTPTGSAGGDDPRATNSLLAAQLDRYSTAKTDVEAAERELEQLRASVVETAARSQDVGALAQKMKEMERDIKVQRELYENLLARRERARVTSSLGRFEQSERIKIIDAPFTPQSSANLPLAVFVVGGLFAGLALGVSLATVLELMDSSIRSRRALETLTRSVLTDADVPMLSRIPPLRELDVADAPSPPILRPVQVLKRRASG